jgi:seryl-tRNA synthetase
MLRIADIKERLQHIEKGLLKKGIVDAREKIDRLLAMDEQRRKTQLELDSVLSKSNTISRQIGALMKAGDKEGADKAKSATTQLKVKTRVLQEQMKAADEELMQLLYDIPNSAHELVPEGKTAEENTVVVQKGTIPELYPGGQTTLGVD